MSGLPRCLRAFAFGLLLFLLSFSNASAHCFVGARFFPGNARDRRSLRRRRDVASDRRLVEDRRHPTGQRMGHLGEIPSASPRISASRSAMLGRRSASPAVRPWRASRDLETTFQYQLLKDGSHELAMLLGLVVDWGGTGATNAGIGTPYSVLTPTYYFGQGFGQLPDTHRMGTAVRGNRSGRISDPDHVLSDVGKAPYSRKCSSTAGRCNTACPT